MRKTNWVEAFSEYTGRMGSPAVFTQWAGIFGVAAALERRVHVRTSRGMLYPNQYHLLVGGPGAGKTIILSELHDLISRFAGEENNKLHLAPTSTSKAGLIDALRDAERKLIDPKMIPPTFTFHSLALISNELGTLLPAWEGDFMNVLTDLYDGRIYSERKRTRELKFRLEHPQLNFIAATTPAYLNSFLPAGAWDEGFISRCMLIYSGPVPPVDLWADTSGNKQLKENLITDLGEIVKMYGVYQFAADAAEALAKWHMAGGPPTPTHPKLQHYNTRRTAHLLKLCMIAAASRTSELIIRLEDYQCALGWLLNLEHHMSDIFKSMAMGGDSKIMDEAWYFAYTIHTKEGGRPIAKGRIMAFLAERAPAHSVQRIYDVMLSVGIIEEKSYREIGLAVTPRARKT